MARNNWMDSINHVQYDWQSSENGVRCRRNKRKCSRKEFSYKPGDLQRGIESEAFVTHTLLPFNMFGIADNYST